MYSPVDASLPKSDLFMCPILKTKLRQIKNVRVLPRSCFQDNDIFFSRVLLYSTRRPSAACQNSIAPARIPLSCGITDGTIDVICARVCSQLLFYNFAWAATCSAVSFRFSTAKEFLKCTWVLQVHCPRLRRLCFRFTTQGTRGFFF